MPTIRIFPVEILFPNSLWKFYSIFSCQQLINGKSNVIQLPATRKIKANGIFKWKILNLKTKSISIIRYLNYSLSENLITRLQAKLHATAISMPHDPYIPCGKSSMPSRGKSPRLKPIIQIVQSSCQQPIYLNGKYTHMHTDVRIYIYIQMEYY